MNTQPSAVWTSEPPRLHQALSRAVADGLSQSLQARPMVFFRADDIGVPGRNIERLMGLFVRHDTPLALAVVPAWLTAERWRALHGMAGEKDHLWCWHQHGWRHVNHEASGKKQEFGGGRGRDRVAADVIRGRQRLRGLMGPLFCPGFTPPWNRCGKDALDILLEQGYSFVSRSTGAVPKPPEGLPDFHVNVDLHTRKEALPDEGWRRLFSEIRLGIAGGRCGVMIHHQRMNEAAFAFLEMFLEMVDGIEDLKRLHLGSTPRL